jgi:tetratricopeptide (TPR) repeat protein
VSKEEARHLYKQGLQLLNAERYVEAIEFFTKAIKFDPEFSDAYSNRGELYKLIGRLIEGNTDLETAKSLRSGKLSLARSAQREIPKLDMNEVESIYDSVYSEGQSGEDSIEFDSNLYDYVFSDDSLDTEEIWDGLVHDDTETRGFPAILEFLGGAREEVSGALLFQPTKEDLTITQEDGSIDRIAYLEQLSCIRFTGMLPEFHKEKNSSCHIEIIETSDGNIYHEAIHPEQDMDNVLLGFSTKEDTRFKFSLLPIVNIKKRHQERYLGDILLEKRFIAGDALKGALEEHQQMRTMKFGKIIAKKAQILYSTVEVELKKAYEGNLQGLKIGEILLAAGLVNEEQILEALQYQESLRNKKIGQFLIEKGIIQEREIYVSLAEKFRIPFVDLRKIKVNKSILSLVPRDIVLKLKVMPIAVKDASLIVATLLPDPGPLCEIILKNSLFIDVKFVLAQPSHLKNIINMLYVVKGIGK